MSYGAVELLKWIAFAAMFVDHVNLVLLGSSQPWMYEIGRFAYPAFALAFGHGLGRSGDPIGIASRLLAPATVAAVAWIVIGTGHFPANVLVLFAGAAVAVALLQWLPAVGFCVLLWIVLTSGSWEGGFLGLALVLGAAGRSRFGSGLWIVAAGAWCYLHLSAGAIVACGAYWLAPCASFAWQHRARWLAWAYPAHLGLFAALAAALRP